MEPISLNKPKPVTRPDRMITLYAPTVDEIPELRARRADFWHSRGFTCEDGSLPPDFIFVRSLKKIAATPSAEEWLLPRFVIDHTLMAVTGSLIFKEAPDKRTGEIEVGYGMAPAYRNQGYATAGVKLMATEAWSHPDNRCLLATVRPDNTPSLRVLAKLGFLADGTCEDPEDGTLLRFILPRPVSAEV